MQWIGASEKMNSGYILHVFLCWSHLSQLAESSIVPEKKGRNYLIHNLIENQTNTQSSEQYIK